eukprot:1241609-Pleurochrysis_carterae.AAC.1
MCACVRAFKRARIACCAVCPAHCGKQLESAQYVESNARYREGCARTGKQLTILPEGYGKRRKFYGS